MHVSPPHMGYIWESLCVWLWEKNRPRVWELTLSHFQDHLHAVRGTHSSFHAIQALTCPIWRSWSDGNTKITQLAKSQDDIKTHTSIKATQIHHFQTISDANTSFYSYGRPFRRVSEWHLQRQQFKTPPEARKCQTTRRQHFNKSSFSSLLEFINTPATLHGLNHLQSTAIAVQARELAGRGG